MKKAASLAIGLWLMAYLGGALGQVPIPLTPDTPIEGEISERGEVDAFSYEGAAGQSITVSVTASVGSSLDTFLQILNPDGSPLAENDDAGDTLGATDSRLNVTLPADGTYQILVSAFAGNSTGAYSLLLEVGAGEPEASTTPDASPAPTDADSLRLELGQATEANLEAGQQVSFIYSGRAGEAINIITTGQFDGVMQFFAPDERILGENDDDQSLMPALYGMVLPLDGDYTLLFFGYDETNFGPFSVIVESAESYPLAQDAPLEFGTGQNGSLLSEEEATYVFSGAEGDIVTVQVVSQLDTTLALLDASLNVLIEDDDSGRGTNPLIRDFRLPADGDYSLRLRAYTSSMSGLYRITLGRVILEDLPRLAIGEEINGTLGLAEAARYRFEGAAGQVVTASVTSDFDAFLTLRSPNWEILLEDDDTGGDFQPLLQSVRLPEAGLYTLIVTGFDNASEGNFTLRLSDDSLAPPPAPTPLINYGEVLTGVMGENGADFLFEGVADDVVTIAVEGNFDSVLTLYDPQGGVVATDDDSGGGVNALLSSLTLPADGQYLIELRAFDGQAGGEYRLSLTREENRDLGSGNSISYGENVQGRLFAGEPTLYTFLGRAGDSLTIEVEASFDAALELRDAQGATLASDDDSGTGVNPRLENIVLPADGEYTLLISAFDPNASGTFTVTINAEQAAVVAQPLERGQKITGVLPLGGAVDYTFEGAVGDVISATALPTDITSDFDLYLELYRPDGTLLLADDDGGWRLNPAIVAASLPQAGTYTLRVQAYGGASEGEFLVSLQSGEVYISPSGEPAQRLTFDAEGNTSFSLTLPANGSALYLFEGVAGQTFTASQSGGELNFFSIYSPDGTVEQQLENGVGFRIVTSTRYLFTIYTSQGGSGNFTLSLVPPSDANIAQPPAVTTPAPPVAEASLREQGEVAAGLPINAVLGTNEAHAWTFIPLYAGVYSVVLNAADPTQPYDPYLRLLDAEGNVLAEDDDSGGAFNALLEALTLEAGQPYTLEVRGFADQVGGAYFLAIIAQEVTLPATVDGGALDIGIPITRRLSQPAQQAEFSLTLAQEGTYTFTLAGLKLPYIDVLDAEGNLVARGAGTLAAQKLEAGAYTVRVYDRLNATGDFILIVGEKREP